MSAGSNFHDDLLRSQEGDRDARGRLLRMIEDDLRRLIRSHFRGDRVERPNHTLQTTAILHDTFLHLVGSRGTSYQDRGHFLAIASKVVRRLLIDHARKHKAAKRGGGAPLVSLDEAVGTDAASGLDPTELLALDQVLERLAVAHPGFAEVVELRYFGGLKNKAIAAALGIAEITVKRRWIAARAWLLRALDGSRS